MRASRRRPSTRGCSVLVMTSLPYARDEDDAKARPVARNVAPADALIALAIALAPTLLLTAAMRRIVRRRLGGYTGDCLGAVQQVAEVGYLIGLLAVLGTAADPVPGIGLGDGSED